MRQDNFTPQVQLRDISRGRRLKWRLQDQLVGVLLGSFQQMPLKLAMRAAGSVFATFGPRTKRAEKVYENIAIAFPDTSQAELRQLVRDSFRSFGVAMAELACLKQIRRERDTRIDFILRPGAARPSPERCTVFVTAHVGAWQLTPLIGPQFGLTIPIIYAPEKNPFLARRLAKLRGAFGCPLVSRDGGIRMLMRALDNGQSIGVTADTRMDAGELLPFFGEEAPTNTAPARLALRYGCNLVPVRAERLPAGRYRVSIWPSIQPQNQQAAAAEQARDMSRQVNALFETWIRHRPHEWVCMKRRWSKKVHRARARRTLGANPDVHESA